MKLQNKKAARYLTYLHFLLLGIVLIFFIVRAVDIRNLSFLNDFSEISGVVAASLFAITLVPGSMQRLGVGKAIYAPLIYYRRVIGLFMYVAANFHFTTVMIQHFLFNPTIELSFDPLLFAGTASILIVTPVYLTSNNFALKYFKKNWKVIQRLTYVAYFVIGLHMFLADQYVLFILYLLVGLFVLASWIAKYNGFKFVK